MTEDQFKEFTSMIAGRQADHDLLIELKTMFKMAHEENQRNLLGHQKDDLKEFTELNLKVDAAHKRLDTFKKDNEVSFDNLSEKIVGIGSLKDRVMGGALVVMFIITTAISLISVLK